jgi:hypothetical protein
VRSTKLPTIMSTSTQNWPSRFTCAVLVVTNLPRTRTHTQ